MADKEQELIDELETARDELERLKQEKEALTRELESRNATIVELEQGVVRGQGHGIKDVQGRNVDLTAHSKLISLQQRNLEV